MSWIRDLPPNGCSPREKRRAMWPSIGFDVMPGVLATLADLPAATRAANESGPGLLLVGAVLSRMRQPGRFTTGEVRARDVTATTSA